MTFSHEVYQLSSKASLHSEDYNMCHLTFQEGISNVNDFGRIGKDLHQNLCLYYEVDNV